MKNNPKECSDRAEWSSEMAFIFSMGAAAVGLGNLWRFPYMVGEHGGGAFILAYLCCLALFGVPIMILEVTVGRLSRGSVVSTYAHVHRYGRFFGHFVAVLTIFITSYYLVITGWTFGYAFDAWRGDLIGFSQFSSGHRGLWTFFIIIAIATMVMIKGVKAIEKISKILMPLLIITVFLLVGIAWQSDGRDQALEFMFDTDFSRLLSRDLWLAALGQSFYTLAIGQGYLMTYGSYIPKKTNVPRASIIVAGVETSIALLAGLMIFPFVFSYGLEASEGSTLAFEALPKVFNDIYGGYFLGIAFFTLFFTAAFSSSLAGLKVIVSAFYDRTSLNYKNSVFVTMVLMLALGLPSAMSYSSFNLSVFGMPFLDFIDQFGGTRVVVSSGLLGAGFFCWLINVSDFKNKIGVKKSFIPLVILYIGRVAPFSLFLIF